MDYKGDKLLLTNQFGVMHGKRDGLKSISRDDDMEFLKGTVQTDRREDGKRSVWG